MPPLIALSPITAMTFRRSPRKSRATAMPSAEEIDVEACAAPNGSYSLSERLVKPDKPPPWRIVRMRSRQPVTRRIKDVVQRDGQLDDAEAGAEVTTGDRDRIDQFRAQLVGQLPQILLGQLAQIGGN